MNDVRSYSTDELKRLTGLDRRSNLKAGEFVAYENAHVVVFCIAGTMGVDFVTSQGYKYTPAGTFSLLQRVKSFTDNTRIDPLQSEMLAELTRRERDPKVSNSRHGGRRVRTTRVGTSGLVLNQRGNDLLRTTDGNYPWLDRDDELVFYVTDDGVIRSAGSSQLTLVG